MIENLEERIKEAKLAQANRRLQSSQRSEEKAMEIDLERLLKQSDIIFTLNGFFIVILTFLLSSNPTIISIIRFLVSISLMLIQSLSLRNIRNKLSMATKWYLNENSAILKRNSRNILKLKTIIEIEEITQSNRKDIDETEKEVTKTTDKLIQQQERLKYISLINVAIVLIVIFIEFEVLSIICNN